MLIKKEAFGALTIETVEKQFEHTFKVVVIYAEITRQKKCNCPIFS